MGIINLNLLISGAAEKLKEVGIEAGTSEAEIILCDLLDCDRLRLYLEGPKLITSDIVNRFNNIIEKRLKRYPLQYILGSAWFFGRKFIVNESVMVPCPETELLLDTVLRAARWCRSVPVRLLDIGTGSGVVAISARMENPTLDVTATDISPKALDVARQNAAGLGVIDEINFIESDLFDALPDGNKFDIIAGNLPYIAEDTYEDLPPEVKADPKTSLLAGEKGLDIIKPLIKEAPDYLNRPGYLAFEIGYDQGEILFEIIDRDKRYIDALLFKDLNDIDRIFLCKV
jgi:release factor glutamine methyltransferase